MTVIGTVNKPTIPHPDKCRKIRNQQKSKHQKLFFEMLINKT